MFWLAIKPKIAKKGHFFENLEKWSKHQIFLYFYRVLRHLNYAYVLIFMQKYFTDLDQLQF